MQSWAQILRPLLMMLMVVSSSFAGPVPRWFALLKAISLPRSVNCESDVGARDCKTKEDEFDKEPCPAALAFLAHFEAGASFSGVLGRGSSSTWVLLVEIVRLDCDNVVVV